MEPIVWILALYVGLMLFMAVFGKPLLWKWMLKRHPEWEENE